MPGERLGLIGPNGSGKSTLVNCICGTLPMSAGSVTLDDQADRRTAAAPAHAPRPRRSFQLPRPFGSLSLAENLRIPILYTVNARATVYARPQRRSTRAAGTARAMVGLAARPIACRATSPRSRCASSSLPAPWRPSPQLLIADEAMAGLSPRRGRRDRRPAAAAERPGRHRHHDRAHHAGRDGILAAPGRAWWPAARSPTAIQDVVTQPGSLEGVSRRVACRSPTSSAGYGAVRVIEDFDGGASGETVALLGTNGNGKSTLMRCVMGLLRPSAGSIKLEIDGISARTGRALDRRDRGSRRRAWCRRAAGCSRELIGRGEPAAIGAFRPAWRARCSPRNIDFCFEAFPRLKERRASSPAA